MIVFFIGYLFGDRLGGTNGTTHEALLRLRVNTLITDLVTEQKRSAACRRSLAVQKPPKVVQVTKESKPTSLPEKKNQNDFLKIFLKNKEKLKHEMKKAGLIFTEVSKNK